MSYAGGLASKRQPMREPEVENIFDDQEPFGKNSPTQPLSVNRSSGNVSPLPQNHRWGSNNDPWQRIALEAPVCTENSNSGILAMQPPEKCM
jgi:hypothetical protein